MPCAKFGWGLWRGKMTLQVTTLGSILWSIKQIACFSWQYAIHSWHDGKAYFKIAPFQDQTEDSLLCTAELAHLIKLLLRRLKLPSVNLCWKCQAWRNTCLQQCPLQCLASWSSLPWHSQLILTNTRFSCKRNVSWRKVFALSINSQWDHCEHFFEPPAYVHRQHSCLCLVFSPQKSREYEASRKIACQIWLALSAGDILGIQGSLDHVKWSVHVRAEISSAGRPFLKSVVYPCQIAIVRSLQTLQTYSCLPKLPHIM